jgi:hypothetical protein
LSACSGSSEAAGDGARCELDDDVGVSIDAGVLSTDSTGLGTSNDEAALNVVSGSVTLCSVDDCNAPSDDDTTVPIIGAIDAGSSLGAGDGGSVAIGGGGPNIGVGALRGCGEDSIHNVNVVTSKRLARTGIAL